MTFFLKVEKVLDFFDPLFLKVDKVEKVDKVLDFFAPPLRL